MERLVMEIGDFYSINKAKIEINKINVVGGVNGSGKSSVSRLFYSFLKANSNRRLEFVLKSIISRINYVIDALDFEGNEYNLPNHLTVEDDFSDIYDAISVLLEISETHEKLANLKKEELSKKILSFKELLISNNMDIDIEDDFQNYVFLYSISEQFNENKDVSDAYSEINSLSKSVQSHVNVHNLCLDIYADVKEFLCADDSTVNEKIFNRILLKEHIENDDFDLGLIINRINRIIDLLDFRGNNYNLPNRLTIDDNLFDLIKTINILLEISKDHEVTANIKKEELKKEILTKFDSIINMLINHDIDVSDILSAVYSTNDDDYTDSLYYIHSIFEEYDFNLDYSDDFYELNNMVNSYNLYNYTSDINQRCLAINSVLNEFFDDNFLLQNEKSIKELQLNDYIKDFNSNIRFIMIPEESDAFSYFFNNYINSVYYMDNVSIFDYYQEGNPFNQRLFHMDELIGDMYGDTYTYELNEDFENIMNKIDKIIKGRYSQNFPIFVTDKQNDALAYIKSSNKNLETYNAGTPSGIKQIGIIQLLLLNDKLKRDGYLIIDEPEVNLHPDWQFKLAEILVLLAKDLNITIYLNSHSPMFIEAIDAFSEYYDMEDDVNYYLTEESDIEGKYDFTKISSDELYKIYDNLGNAYDLIDQLRLRKHLGE